MPATKINTPDDEVVFLAIRIPKTMKRQLQQVALDEESTVKALVRSAIESDLLELSLHRLRYTDGEEDDFFVDGVLLGGWHRDVLPVSWTAQR